MPTPSPMIQYRNINPFRARCGNKFALQTPQLLPAALADLLPCEICIYPKEAERVKPTAGYDTTACWQEFMDDAGKVDLPGVLFMDVNSWTSYLDPTNPWVTSVGSGTIPLWWTKNVGTQEEYYQSDYVDIEVTTSQNFCTVWGLDDPPPCAVFRMRFTVKCGGSVDGSNAYLTGEGEPYPIATDQLAAAATWPVFARPLEDATPQSIAIPVILPNPVDAVTFPADLWLYTTRPVTPDYWSRIAKFYFHIYE